MPYRRCERPDVVKAETQPVAAKPFSERYDCCDEVRHIGLQYVLSAAATHDAITRRRHCLQHGRCYS